ncbi:MAG: hypothetical protein OHK93_002950 [Ramalina farinacea]|uniref:peptidyl-tRNA hydrolase n=1 Tax=Ramalina farinacea TaxID=258253 RepID=A0AA43QSH5_9LECA|nr:hypothetical protein [Ramalina farinacea]
MLRRPLLIASLGNPAPYGGTFHSAGHLLVSALANHLSYPPFTRSRAHAKGTISRGEDALIWRCPTFMNVSGPAVATTWHKFLQDTDVDQRKRARLVVVHDELESPLGSIKLKKEGSAKGHNGLKSCMQSLGGIPFYRLGVGIGRPASRDSGVVAAYVLRKMTPEEIGTITSRLEEVAEELGKLAEEA